jgi:hypothetical protein
MVKSLSVLSRIFRIAAIAILAGFCFSRSAPSGAQAPAGSASISGTVVDPDGTPIPGASVALTNLVTGQKATASTDGAGAFTFSNPPRGPATILVSAPRFNSSGPINRTVNGAPIVLNPVKLTYSIGPPVGATQHELTSTPAGESYVTVSSNAVAGPMGYAATPSLDGATQSPQSAQQQAFIAGQQFNYPSIIFYVSAAPLVNLPNTNATSMIEASQETDRNPLWLDASFTLSFYDRDGNPLAGACSDGSVQVLGLMPQQTVAALKNQTIADVASAANDVAGALATFYPGTSSEVGAATKAMNIVFQDIFPPKPVAYEYSDMTDNCDFGWYFRPNTTATGSGGQASILGIQTGIALLKTAKSIASIKVNGRSLSAWNNSPTADKDKEKDKKNKLFLVDDRPIGIISLPSTDNIDYDNITSLVMFPALIPKAQAMKILHIDKDADFVAFATANKLVGTNNTTFDYITNSSLENFLGLKSPTAPDGSGGGKPPDPKPKNASTTPPAAATPKGTETPAKAATPADSTPAKPARQPSPRVKPEAPPKPAPSNP